MAGKDRGYGERMRDIREGKYWKGVEERREREKGVEWRENKRKKEI